MQIRKSKTTKSEQIYHEIRIAKSKNRNRKNLKNELKSKKKNYEIRNIDS